MHACLCVCVRAFVCSVTELDRKGQQTLKTVRKVRRYIDNSNQHKTQRPMSILTSTTLGMNKTMELFHSPEVNAETNCQVKCYSINYFVK
jgi:transposase